jgi:hypothetical protein
LSKLKVLSGLLLLSLLAALPSAAQSFRVSGRVTDAETGEGMPFVNVFFKGTTSGATTDFDGYYKLAAGALKDSLYATYIGYQERGKPVNRSLKEQTVDFQLSPSAVSLKEVSVYSGENPAWALMRQVVRHKDKNDKRALSFYEYESYNKIEVDVDNLSEKFRKRKAIQKIQRVIDSIQVIAGEDGKPVMPLFISESVSDFYYRRDPTPRRREFIRKTKLTGVGLQDGSLVSQLIGSSLQEYNFYQNWLNILEKDFVSPLADGWKSYYNYYLIDSLNVNGHFCYRLDFDPKRAQDLAFTGSLWIDKESFAVVQVDATVDKGANLNFIEKIKIQQELEPTDAGPWLPSRTRVLVDVAEVTNASAGMLAKFYTSNDNFVVNKERDVKFYEIGLELSENAQTADEAFWQENRHDPLTPTEQNVYAMIDSIKNIPTIKTYVELANILVNGYKKVGPIDVGPYVLAYSFNDLEGHRFRAGFKTNIDFSKKWVFKGAAAYGTHDLRWKYSGEAQYIIDRKPWSVMGLKRYYDVEQVGLLTEDIWDNTLFLTSSRFGTLRRPFLYTENAFYAQSDVARGFTQRLRLRNWSFDPLYNFTYFRDPSDPESTRSGFTTSEVILESRITRGELFVQNDNVRLSLGTNKPIFTLRYTLGVKGVLGSDFNYHKFHANLSQSVNVGTLGRSYYSLSGGFTPSRLPYPLLQAHLGNETVFYNTAAFNLMNRFEFVSDRYASLQFQHSFEGLLFNRIPLVRKLKWRLVGTANVLWGSLSPQNIGIIPDEVDLDGVAARPFGALGDVPYVELGYGIENIFKFIRVDAIHRVTYRNRPGVSTFGAKVSTQFKL